MGFENRGGEMAGDVEGGGHVPVERARFFENADPMAVDETPLTPAGSVFEHEVRGVRSDAVGEAAAEAFPASLAFRGEDALARLNILGSLHENSLRQQERLQENLEAAQRKLDAQTETSTTYERAVIANAHEARRAIWEAMPKGPDGYASGEESLRYAVGLSARYFGLHTDGDNQAVVDEAFADNTFIYQGQPTIIRHEYNQQVKYEGGIPAQDGFVIGFPQPDNPHYPFTVGITEPRIPADEAWMPASSFIEGEPLRDPIAPLAFSMLQIRSGERAGAFVSQECDSLLDRLDAVYEEDFEAGATDGLSPTELYDERMESWHKQAGALAELVLAARDAQQPLVAEGESNERLERVTTALTEHLMNKGSRTVANTIEAEPFAALATLRPVGEALRHVARGIEEPFIDAMVGESVLREREGDPSHNQMPLLWVLQEHFGLSEIDAETRLRTRRQGN